MVGNGGPDSYQVVFLKDNVSVHPTRYARERISGLLRLTKQGSSLLMTWTPPPFDSGGRRESTVMGTAEKDTDLYAIRSVSLAEMLSIRCHTPPVGLQYIIIVLTSGLSFPPLYFHTGGVNEFFATLRNHALLVRSIDDPSVYFVKNVRDDFENQEKEKETKRKEMEKEKKEKEENEKKEKEKLEQEREIEKKIAEEEAANNNGSPALVSRRARPPPLSHEERATFLDNEVQVLDPKPVTWPDVTYNHPLSSMHHTMGLDTPPRKRYRRCARDLPTLPPADNITLTFTPTFTPSVSLRQYRKTVDLVLPVSPTARTSSIPVDRRWRKTCDLVLYPDSTRVDVSPVIPHTTPIFVGTPVAPGQSGTTPFASTVVEKEVPSLLRTVEEDAVKSSPVGGRDSALLQSPLIGRLSDGAAPSNTLESVEHFFRVYCSGSFGVGVALPISWRSRLHLAELSSDGGALVRRRREWWLGTSLSASVATGIPSHVIGLLFTSELFTRLMIDSGLTYKALNALKYIDKFGVLKHMTSGDICKYLKTFFSKAIRNRLRWQRMGGVVLDDAQPLATSMILPYKHRPGVQQQNNVHPLAASVISPSGVSQENVNRQKPSRRWVPRSAREALRQVFEDWGHREITPDETVVLAAQFQGNPDAMQIMQLFRNWAQTKRRNDRTAESSSSQAQPTTGRRRKLSEAATQAQDAQQALPHVKKRPVRGVFSGSTSLQPETQPSSMEEKALMARGVLRQAFEDRDCREITMGEAIGLAVGLQGSPNATQIQQMFSNWAEEKRRHDKAVEEAKKYQEQLMTYRQALQRTRLLEEAAKQAGVARQAKDAQQAYLHINKLPIKKLPIKKLPVVSTVSGCNSLESESQPTSMKDTPLEPAATEESRQLITERQALQRTSLFAEAARQVDDAQQAYEHIMKPLVPITVSGSNSLQSESQPPSMECTPPGPPALEESRRRVQGSSRRGRRQSRSRGASLPVTQ